MLEQEWGDADVKAACAARGGDVAFAANAEGKVASFDVRRSLKQSGSFKGVQGSVRALTHHPDKPLLACFGLDRYVHFFHPASRASKGALYVKQQGSSLAFLPCSFASDERPRKAARADDTF